MDPPSGSSASSTPSTSFHSRTRWTSPWPPPSPPALLYPYNAKFGILSKGLPLKYDGFPNHYVPEVMMGALAVAGCIAKFVKK